MAGHSRWAQIRHKKVGVDARRGVLFSKFSRLISVAARGGGPDPAANPKLRQAVEQARAAGLPKDIIERATRRALASAETLTAVEYEAYGPGGMALLIAGLTNNPNRTTAEVKRILADGGGRLAEAGSVAWLFERRTAADFPTQAASREAVELALIEAGAEDTAVLEDRIRALLRPEAWPGFAQTLAARGLTPIQTLRVAIPTSRLTLKRAERTAAEELLRTLQAHPDVTEVWTNVADDEPIK